MLTAAPPWHVRAIRSIVRRAPRGRYRLLSALPARGRFLGRLAADVGGARFACDLSDLIAREAYFTGLYEPPVTRVVQRHLSTGAMFVDVGANWGYFALVGAAAVGPSGRVVALEPDPRMVAALDANVQTNGFDQVTAIAAAADARAGRARLAGYDDRDRNRGISRITDAAVAGPVFDVRSVAIDALTADRCRVDLVKIDVEGAEDAVLEGMRDGLSRGRYLTVVLELHPQLLRERGVDPEQCLRRLSDTGYEGWTIDASAAIYRRALNPAVPTGALLAPLDRWRSQAWPHVLWRRRDAAPAC